MLELGNNWLSLDGVRVLGDDRVREHRVVPNPRF